MKNIILTLFLLVSITSFAQNLSSKNKAELQTMQQKAVASENYDLAEKIKAQLERLEINKDKIAQLEKEKESALTIEDYDKVIALEKEINALKSGKKNIPTAAKPIEKTPKVLPPKPVQHKPAPKKKRSAMQRYFKPKHDGT